MVSEGFRVVSRVSEWFQRGLKRCSFRGVSEWSETVWFQSVLEWSETAWFQSGFRVVSEWFETAWFQCGFRVV